MNKNVFKNLELMENILGVTSYLREKIIKKGGDPDRETLNVIPALDGKPYYQDSFGITRSLYFYYRCEQL